MNSSYVRKPLAVAVILLFIVLAFAPSIHAIVNRKSSIVLSKPLNDKLVKVTVYECKPDGTREKAIIKMPCEQIIKLEEKIQSTEDSEERLLTFKNYGLIPQNVTSEKLRAGMEEKARSTNLNMKKLDKITNVFRNKFSFFDFKKKNSKCLVDGVFLLSLCLLIGTSPIVSFINTFLFPYYNLLLSIDLIDVALSAQGCLITADGLQPDWYGLGSPNLMIMAGFVGYFMALPLPIFFSLGLWFWGYAEFVFFAWNEVWDPT